MSADPNSTTRINSKIIAANWKMNGSEELLKEFSEFEVTKGNDVIMCLPFTLLDLANTLLPNFIKIGAQNCSEEDKGAFTGEVSASMLRERNVSYVIVGHSERRTLFRETDSTVFRKVQLALKNGIIPIVCIGETLLEKKKKKTFEVLDRQIEGSISKIETPVQLIVAYEPVWAIGTGLTPNINEIEETHFHIKQKLGEFFDFYIPILYGGSANSENCDEIISVPHVSGLLVGGASLEKRHFAKICNC